MIALETDPVPILAPFWIPKSDYIGSKRAPRSIKKVIEKLTELGTDFGTIFGRFWLPTWSPQGVQRIGFSVSSRLPEPPWSLNGPRDPSRLDFWSIWLDFGSILGRFWVDVGRFLAASAMAGLGCPLHLSV